jgi:hypothetical protein
MMPDLKSDVIMISEEINIDSRRCCFSENKNGNFGFKTEVPVCGE